MAAVSFAPTVMNPSLQTKATVTNKQHSNNKDNNITSLFFEIFFKILLVDVLLHCEILKPTILIITLFDDVLLFWKMLR